MAFETPYCPGRELFPSAYVIVLGTLIKDELLEKLKKDLAEGEALTRDALHKMNEVLPVKEVPETESLFS